MRKFIDIIIL